MLSKYFSIKTNSVDFEKALLNTIEKLQGKKVLIYGAGEGFQALNKKYKFSAKLNIIGIADKKFEENNIDKFLDITAIKPQNIPNIKYDVILVSNEDSKSIIRFLTEDLNIEEKNIETIFKKDISDEIWHNQISNKQKDFFYAYNIKRDLDFWQMMSTRDILKDYKELINGLDSQSIEIVNDIIAYSQNIHKSNYTCVDIFTPEQIKQINIINKSFKNNIIRLNDNCFAWKNYFLPINHFETSVFYYKHHINDLNNIEKLRDKNILDVGGFIGDSALVLSEYTDKKVLSFEPTTESFNQLQETIILNNTKKIIPYKFALGNKDEFLKINIEKAASSIIQPLIKSTGTEYIQVRTLDNFIKEHPMEIGLVKVDIEGFEQQFLQGAKKTIYKQKPTLLISIYHSFEDFFGIKKMIESWNLGYKFKIRKPIDGTIHLETILIAEIFD